MAVDTQATTRSGKPVQVGDQVSIVGTVTAVSGTGPTAVLTILLTSGVSLTTPKASDVYAAQTL